MEIERKWMVKGWPEQDLPLLVEHNMRQGYLSVVPTVRIREEDAVGGKTAFILCFKSAGGLARKEIEMPVEKNIFHQLEDLIGLPLIPKVRRTYLLPDGSHLEVNHVDEGQPTEFWYAEVEYASIEEANAWQPADVGLAAYLDDEVTGKPGQSMGAYWIQTRKPVTADPVDASTDIASADIASPDGKKKDPAEDRSAAPSDSIYGKYKDTLPIVMNEVVRRISAHNDRVREETGDGIYEHLESRVKGEQSMREKCDRKGLPQTPESALSEITDSIGLRIITRFVDDIYSIVDYLKSFPDLRVIREKDYIRQAKPNGYRSYHLILEVTVPFEDVHGNNPGHYYVEIQLRTIAMDMWASLEHQLKYKHNIANEKIITSELKRSADELASCDISMQTIRSLIREGNQEAAQHEKNQQRS